ncbi:hypothetical protein JTB14_029151 [Gonioctena quinquepunctata]|nr:hypothetical protein JTB14_029151 [Gonioctena quinquepunctata]
MPSSCATYNCVVRYKKGLDVKFHRFPKNELMRNNWVLAIRRKDYKPSATAEKVVKEEPTEIKPFNEVYVKSCLEQSEEEPDSNNLEFIPRESDRDTNEPKFSRTKCSTDVTEYKNFNVDGLVDVLKHPNLFNKGIELSPSFNRFEATK